MAGVLFRTHIMGFVMHTLGVTDSILDIGSALFPLAAINGSMTAGPALHSSNFAKAENIV